MQVITTYSKYITMFSTLQYNAFENLKKYEPNIEIEIK